MNATLNIHGRLFSLSSPQVMGIVNLTPDSFYSASRHQDADSLRQCVLQMEQDGATIIDVGACSTRPGAAMVSAEEEMERLRWGLGVITQTGLSAVLSVDTFRADVARMCVEEFGVGIINDISGGEMDKGMFPMVSRLKVPYVLSHIKGTPQTMQSEAHYEHLLPEMYGYFCERIQQLCDGGVNDIILDPGFGFAKTLDDNYELLGGLEIFRDLQRPLLVGVSRKSMICKLLGIQPEEALNGTTVVNTLALQNGANILRVHDVKPAVEAVRIYQKMIEIDNIRHKEYD